MFVEIIKFVKRLDRKKIINIMSVFVTFFVVLNTFTAFAADEQIPKLDAVKGYQDALKTTQILTKDPSYNSQTTMQNTILGSMNGLVQEIVPQIYSNYGELQASNEVPNYVKGGLVGFADASIYALMNNYSGVNIPSHLASEWVPGYDTSSAGIYAATDGYSYLQESNINVLWDKVRLVAYVFFVVVLIVAGFLIMFRQKIGGQLAISVFNTLPNVIVALILVTFSFAIVGLTLNFAVMLVNVMGSVLGISATNAIVVDNPFSLWTALLTGKISSGAGLNTVTVLVPVLIGGIIGLFSPAGPVMAVVGALIGLLVIAIIISAIVIFASIRVYMTLLTAYLTIILNTILAPGILAISAFPGQSGMAKDWFYRILKGALTFPIVFFFLNLGAFILSDQINIGFPSGIMTGDFANVPTGGTLVGTVLKSVLVLVLFFFAADAPKLLDDFIVTKAGDGAKGAIEGMKKGMSKIPLVGSFFG